MSLIASGSSRWGSGWRSAGPRSSPLSASWPSRSRPPLFEPEPRAHTRAGTYQSTPLSTDTCANLYGSYQVTGQATLPNGQHLPFSAVYMIFPNGYVQGTSSSFFPNLQYTGGESCLSGTGGVSVSNVANAASHVSASKILGSANFTVDTQGTLHANGSLAVLPPLCGCTGAVVSTVTATAVPLPSLSIYPAPLPAHPGPVNYAVFVPSSPFLPEVATGTVSVSDGQGGQCSNIPLPPSGFVNCTMTENAAPGCPYHVVADYSGDNTYASGEATLVRVPPGQQQAAPPR